MYGDVDMEQMIDAKTLHDVVGHYNRFDVLSLVYQRRRPKPIRFEREDASATDEGELTALMKRLLARLEPGDGQRGPADAEAAELRRVLARAASQRDL